VTDSSSGSEGGGAEPTQAAASDIDALVAAAIAGRGAEEEDSPSVGEPLFHALRTEIEREASFYISTMNGVIEGGRHFIDAVRAREAERAKEREEASAMAAIEDAAHMAAASLRPADERSPPPAYPAQANQAITAAPMGFQVAPRPHPCFAHTRHHLTSSMPSPHTSNSPATT
jgi:hypothetical protein